MDSSLSCFECFCRMTKYSNVCFDETVDKIKKKGQNCNSAFTINNARNFPK